MVMGFVGPLKSYFLARLYHDEFRYEFRETLFPGPPGRPHTSCPPLGPLIFQKFRFEARLKPRKKGGMENLECSVWLKSGKTWLFLKNDVLECVLENVLGTVIGLFLKCSWNVWWAVLGIVLGYVLELLLKCSCSCSWTVRGTVLGDVLGLFLKCSCQCSWGCSCLFFKKKTLISQLFLTPTWNVLDTVLGIVLGPVIELFLSCSWTVIGTVLGAVIELFLLCSWACSWACSWFLVFFAWKHGQA